jgi:hypothetical protein
MAVTLKDKTLDAALRRAGFKHGESVEYKVSPKMVTIVPREQDDEEYTRDERRAISIGVAQSEKEYREGKNAGPFPTAEEFLADLHRETAKLDATKRTRRRK